MKKKLDIPKDRYYDRTSHLWIRPVEDGVVEIGLDQFNVENIGDLAYLSFERAGTLIKKGSVLGKLEAAKMVDNIVSPVSGKILELNEMVLRNPISINAGPYDNWIVKIKPDDWDQDKGSFVSGVEVDSWAEEEFARSGRSESVD